MIYNINEFLTEGDIMQINNIKQHEILKNFDINKNIINCSYLQSRNLLLIYNYFITYNNINICDKYYVLTIINIISKDIILYLLFCNGLIRFFNYKKKIYKLYNNTMYIYYATKEISINKNGKNIIIKRNNSKFIKKYKNNKIYMYSLYRYINNTCIYIFNIYYNKYNYKMYKKNIYLHKINFNIYKNILI